MHSFVWGAATNAVEPPTNPPNLQIPTDSSVHSLPKFISTSHAMTRVISQQTARKVEAYYASTGQSIGEIDLNIVVPPKSQRRRVERIDTISSPSEVTDSIDSKEIIILDSSPIQSSTHPPPKKGGCITAIAKCLKFSLW